MIHLSYLVYALAVYAYTGRTVIEGDRDIALFLLSLIELLIELMILFIVCAGVKQ